RGEQDVELVNLRVQAVGMVHRPSLREEAPRDGGGPVQARERRSVYFGDWVDTPIYDRAALAVEARLSGPANVEEFGSTTVVFPGWTARVDAYRNLVMDKED
ncbi:MAG: N-methylhydantoinase, partial [Solirubrobacteraceae bacterium]|nr:N-methylhydantoinase [Solirubrobacteraceae bacterium]